MFFGMPRKIYNENGIGIWGVIGFVGALNKLINLTEPTHVAIIFDGEGHNPRCDVLEEYKANRPDYSELGEEENPFIQLPLVYQAIESMGIHFSEVHGCECDDVIASYAKRFGKELQVVISSFDSDYFQLITDNVRVVRYRGLSSVICDKNYVRERYGITPEYYADWKSLVGDTADNNKGIPGVGAKTATRLINNYGSLSEMLANVEEVQPEKLREKIREGKEILLRNYSLIRLDDTGVLPFEIEELEYTAERIKTMDVLRKIELLS
jgi:DNA polymerase-1